MQVLYKDKKDITEKFKKALPGFYLGAMEKLTDEMKTVEILSVKFSKVAYGTISNFPNLKYIVIRGHGTDIIDKQACKKRGIKIIQANPTAYEVANKIISLIEKHNCKKPIILFGNGAIGSIIAKNLPDVIIVTSKIKVAPKILRGCKTIISALSLNDSTVEFFNEELLSNFKNAHFISASRSETVNNKDLLKAILKGHIKYAIIDTLGSNLREDLLKTNKVEYTKHTFWKHGFNEDRYISAIKAAINSIGEKRVLINLPYEASTNKYPRYFPLPLNLLAIKEPKDILIDINLLSYKKKKEEIFGILKHLIDKIKNTNVEIIVNCGDYAPDGDKYEYYEFFIKHINKPVTIYGPYTTLNSRIEILRREGLEIKIGGALNEWDHILIDTDLLSKYPPVGTKKKVNLNFSFGCPRRCSYCPTGLLYGHTYKIYSVKRTLAKIVYYYRQGVRFFNFIDDNISANPKKFVSFLIGLKQTIKKYGMKGVTFQSQEGFEIGALANLQLCKLLKETGWTDIKVGLENINKDFLKKLKKPYANANKFHLVDEMLSNIKEIGLSITAYYLLGLDETREEVMENYRFIAKHGLGLRINILRPYEGTLYATAPVKKKLSDKELKKLKALGYAIAWAGQEKGVDVFSKRALEVLCNKLGIHYKNTKTTHKFTGKVYLGFATAKLITVLKLILGIDASYKVIKDKEKIIFEKC